MKKAAPAPTPPKKSVAAPSAPAPAPKSVSARPDSSAGAAAAPAKRVGSASSARPVAAGGRPASPSTTTSPSNNTTTAIVSGERRVAIENVWKRLLKRMPELGDPQLWKRISGEGRLLGSSSPVVEFKTDNAHRARLTASVGGSGSATVSVKGAVMQSAEVQYESGERGGDGAATVALSAPAVDDKIVLRGDQRREWTRSSRTASGSGSALTVHSGSICFGDISVNYIGPGKSTLTYKCDPATTTGGSSSSPVAPTSATLERSGDGMMMSAIRITHASGATSVVESRKNGAEMTAQLLDSRGTYTGGVQWNSGRTTLRLAGNGKLTCGASTYDGGWKDGVRHGQGTFTICGPTGPTVQYAGPWQNDERHGADGSITLYSPMCNVLVTSSWARGELDGAATIGVAGAPNAHVKQLFSAGTLGSTVTLWMETGHFTGQWNDPQAALQFASAQSQAQPSFLKCDTSAVSKTFKEVAEALAAVDAVAGVEHRATERHLLLPTSKAMLAEQLGFVGTAVVALQLEAAADELEVEALSGVTKERDELKMASGKAAEAVQKRQSKLDALHSERTKAQASLDAAQIALEKEEGAGRAAGGPDGDGDLSTQHKALCEQRTYLQGALTTAQAQLVHAKAELKTVQGRISQLVKDSKAGDEEGSKLAEKLAALSAQRASLQQKLADVERDFDASVTKREAAKKELQAQLDTLQQTIANAQTPTSPEDDDRRAATVKAELKDAQARIAALKKTIQSSSNAKDSEADLEAKNRSLEKLKAQLKQAQAAKVKLAEDVEALAAVSDYLRHSLRQVESAAEAIEKQQDGQGTDAGSDARRDLQHSAALNDVAVQLAECDTSIDSLAKENKSKEGDVRQLEAALAAALEAAPQAALSPSPPPKQRRSDELELQVKQLLSKCDQLRRKRDNIEERIGSLNKQLQDIQNRQQKKVEEEKAAGSSYNCRSSNGLDVAGYTTAELKALVQKMRSEMEAAEAAVAQRRLELERSLEELAAARKRRNDAQHAQPKTGDWKLKVLQDEVDAREARIASLRSDQRRIQLLEARIEAAKEAVRNMTQSSEIRQNQAVSMARADQEWSHTTTLARAGSIVNRQASVAQRMHNSSSSSNLRSSFSFDN